MATTTRPTTTPAPAPPATRSSTIGADLFAKTVPFVYERHSFGEHKKTSMAQVDLSMGVEEEVQKPEKSYFSLQKRLLEMPELNAIRQHDTAFRNYLKNEAATPWRPGLYLVPQGLVVKTFDRATAWEAGRRALALKAGEVYLTALDAARTKLTVHWNPGDYPTLDRFLATFWVKWRFVEMGTPRVLQDLKVEVFEQEKAKMEAEGRQALALIRQHTRAILLEITEHLANLLTPKEDGKFKALREGALDDLTSFLDTAKLRDVTNDVDLQNVVRTLKGLGKGLDIEVLKDDKVLRARTAAILEDAKAALEPLVVARSRAIRVRE